MKHRTSRPFVLPGLVVALAIALAALPAPAAAAPINLVSVDQEWQLGQQIEQDASRQLHLVDDGTVRPYVDRIVQRLADETSLGQLPWRTHLVANPELNAMDMPGGLVYVNTGLVANVDTTSELAGVLAHEVAHGALRHGTQQLTRAYGFNLLAGLVLGRNPSMLQQLLAQLTGAGTFAKFSRDAEAQADATGVRLMYEAGYDPRGMADIFRKLLASRHSRPNAVAQFFSSHPLTESRIAAVEAEARRLPARRLVRDDGRLDAVAQRAARLGR